mmetsp:Transcript_40594/g.116669  ORF Transcript_40594/g.116669 Transcript_40594/m.116669 type:complete len:251 (+) Transcript_40594:598-1350(+)
MLLQAGGGVDRVTEEAKPGQLVADDAGDDGATMQAHAQVHAEVHRDLPRIERESRQPRKVRVLRHAILSALALSVVEQARGSNVDLTDGLDLNEALGLVATAVERGEEPVQKPDQVEGRERCRHPVEVVDRNEEHAGPRDALRNRRLQQAAALEADAPLEVRLDDLHREQALQQQSKVLCLGSGAVLQEKKLPAPPLQPPLQAADRRDEARRERHVGDASADRLKPATRRCRRRKRKVRKRHDEHEREYP